MTRDRWNAIPRRGQLSIIAGFSLLALGASGLAVVLGILSVSPLVEQNDALAAPVILGFLALVVAGGSGVAAFWPEPDFGPPGLRNDGTFASYGAYVGSVPASDGGTSSGSE